MKHGVKQNVHTAATSLPSSSGIDDPRVAAAMEHYLEALEQGRAPPRKEFLHQHPEIAQELAGCLEGLSLVHQAVQVIRPPDATAKELSAEELQQPLGDFRIVRQIGRGGMGVVYEAVQLSLGRRVALKILPLAAALDPKHLQRFKNEAQAAAQLHHTNIVPVYAVGSERGVHYYSMQLIDGHSLSDLIEHRRQLLGKSISTSFLHGAEPPTEKATAPNPARAGSTEVTQAFEPAPGSAAQQHVETVPRGSTLRTAGERNSKTYYRSVAGLIRQAALALDHAHHFGVVHRDIKPANLLLDERGNLWVTDFGLALFQANMQLTRTGDVLGTMRYMSPEQASGDRVVLDHRTDIYSLGVTLYELLTLEPPIPGDDPQTVLRRIVEDEPRPPRTIDKQIPPELETIVLKAIAKTPSERYATAADMADDLQRWLDDQPIRARRPTLLERTARWSRRHWSLIAVAACILAVATLGLLTSTILIATEHAGTLAALKSESQQRDAAVKQRIEADRQRQLADSQRKAADESFRQARQAVDTFVGLSEEELASKPQLQQLRGQILAAALEYYDNFLEQRQDDPAAVGQLAETSRYVQQIVEELAALDLFASFALLLDEHVQDDLELSPDKRKQVEKLVTAAGSDAGLDRGGPERAIPQEGQHVSARAKELSAKLDGLLTNTQIRRWRQLALQQRGPLAFKSPEVVAALQLTSQQRKQISAIIQEESPGWRDGRRPPPRGMPGRPPNHGGDHDFREPPPPPPPPHDGFGPGGHPREPRDFDGPPHGNGGFGPPPPPDNLHDFDVRRPGDKGGKSRPGGKGGFGGTYGKGPPKGKAGPDDRGDDDRGPGKPPPFGRGGKGPGGRGGPDGFGGPGGPPEGRGGPPGQEDLRRVMDRTIERILALLKPEQRSAWQELVGPPFEYDLQWRLD